MLRLDIVPGLRPEDDWINWHYKMREKHQDMPLTKEHYEAHPPSAGDAVVVLHTWAGKMMKPHVTTIETITARKRGLCREVFLENRTKLLRPNRAVLACAGGALH